MENKQNYISVESLMDIIKVLIKDEIVATYTEEKTAMQINFKSGQSFRVFVEEVLI